MKTSYLENRMRYSLGWPLILTRISTFYIVFHGNYSLKCNRNGVIWKIVKFSFESRHDDIPLRYRQIRCGERQVKPEYYLLMHVPRSKYLMSENIAQGATSRIIIITEVANYLFDQKEHGNWKPYKSGGPYDSIATLCHHHLTLTGKNHILKSWYFQILYKK